MVKGVGEEFNESVEGLKTKTGFPSKKQILPEDHSVGILLEFSACRFETQHCNVNSYINFQTVSLLYRF